MISDDAALSDANAGLLRSPPRASAWTGPKHVALALLALVGLSSCSTSPSSDLATPADPQHRLESLVAIDARVAHVGYKLSVANADLCAETTGLVGWSLHAASLYSSEMRPRVQEHYGLFGDLPGILYVTPGSPADAAGLKVGDLILSADGHDLQVGPLRREATYEAFAVNEDVVERALAEGPTSLRVQRRGGVVDVTVTPVRGCAYDFQVDPSPDFYARADADRVYISTALASYAADDTDLAVILGHELAHAALNHAAQRGGMGGLPWRTAAREAEADRVGLYMMARADFDPVRGPAFWRRFGRDHWQARYAQWGHPSAEARARALDATAAEIARQRAGSVPILP
jgi:hypothetical protein